MSEQPKDELLTITAQAREALLALRAQDPAPDSLGLRIAVAGERDGRYLHDMSFELLEDASPEDVVLQHDDLPVIVPQDSMKMLRGAVVDLAPDGQSWTIDNPNRPKRMLPLAPVGGVHAGHGDAGHEHAASPAAQAEIPEELRGTLQGDTAQQVIEVLDRHINPSIAMHGGRAELAGLKDGVAYLRLSGGCQGCSMAAVTLRQGIERSLRQLVPEIEGVADVTDHASGTDPFYSSSKS
ncbi:MAG TPA: NifU family protein [Actinomycetota bacterium]